MARRDRSSRHADRQRRWRARQVRGDVVAPVAVSIAVVETLIALRWLRPEESEDRKEVGAAIASMLEDLAHSRPKNP